MDKLSEHATNMLKIIENENGFYRNEIGDTADIARAVYDIILQLEVNEAKKTEP